MQKSWKSVRNENFRVIAFFLSTSSEWIFSSGNRIIRTDIDMNCSHFYSRISTMVISKIDQILKNICFTNPHSVKSTHLLHQHSKNYHHKVSFCSTYLLMDMKHNWKVKSNNRMISVVSKRTIVVMMQTKVHILHRHQRTILSAKNLHHQCPYKIQLKIVIVSSQEISIHSYVNHYF